MARSDSSDSGRSRKHSRNKKKSKQSRPNSSDSDDSSRKYKKHKKERTRDRRRSRSRERRGSRSREQNKSRSRSWERKKSRSRERNKSRSRSRERNRSRSRSKERSSKVKTESMKSQEKQISSGWDAKPYLKSQDACDSSKTKTEKIDERTLDKLTLKERIKLLTGKSDSPDVILKPSSEEIGKIEGDNFIQENFSSTYNHPGYQPKQKKKKKRKQLQKLQENIEVKKEEELAGKNDIAMISHECAIFGNTLDTLHVARFSRRLDSKRKDELRKLEKNDDLIFGAMFFDKPEVRMKRWVTKLKTIRKLLIEDDEEEEES